MKLSSILPPLSRSDTGVCISFLGGGGKTGLIQRLGQELAARHRVLMTSLTKSGPHPELTPVFLRESQNREPVFQWDTNPVFLMGFPITEGKYQGIETGDLDRIRHLAHITLVENDGSRNLPLKIHSDYDPPVPEFADQVVIVVGADAVGRTPREIVHRWDRFCPHWNQNPKSPMTVEFIAGVVTSEKGYLAKVPHRNNLVYFVNKADLNPVAALRLAQAIQAASPKPVYWGSVRQGKVQTITTV